MIETDHIGLVKCRQPINTDGDAAPECRFAAPGVLNAKAVKHLLEQAVLTEYQHVAGIKQRNHQQWAIATPGKSRTQVLHQRVELRQMALRLLLFTQQVGHFQ